MFRVYIHSENTKVFTDEIFEKIDYLLSNKLEVYVATNYSNIDKILHNKYRVLNFENVYNSIEYSTFNDLDAVIFVNNYTIDGDQNLLQLAREKNLKIRIIK